MTSAPASGWPAVLAAVLAVTVLAAADAGLGRTTGVRPSSKRRGSPCPPDFLDWRRVRPAARSRGLMNSSMPKLSSASEVPRKATASPGGMYHHQ